MCQCSELRGQKRASDLTAGVIGHYEPPDGVLWGINCGPNLGPMKSSKMPLTTEPLSSPEVE